MKLLKNLYACAVCSESFSAAKFLVSHVQTKHLSDKNKREDKETKVQDMPLIEKFKKVIFIHDLYNYNFNCAKL